ncbi:hypothetical protein DFH06DRAFT_1236843 [Mycena polygramma]|nr:hypothetical protein DFH06DRAFT_1236843 [Mycena polygramma]
MGLGVASTFFRPEKAVRGAERGCRDVLEACISSRGFGEVLIGFFLDGRTLRGFSDSGFAWGRIFVLGCAGHAFAAALALRVLAGFRAGALNRKLAAPILSLVCRRLSWGRNALPRHLCGGGRGLGRSVHLFWGRIAPGTKTGCLDAGAVLFVRRLW